MKKTCRVIITNDILKDTQGSLYSTQQELLSRMKCDTPELVPIIALVYLTSVNPSSYRGSTYPYAYGDTRCSEQLEGFPVIIGNHGTDGLTIIDDAEDLSAKIGIGAMRKLDN